MGELVAVDRKEWLATASALGETGRTLRDQGDEARLDYSGLLRISGQLGYLVRNASFEAQAEFPIFQQDEFEAVMINMVDERPVFSGSFGRGMGIPLVSGRLLVATQSRPFDLFERTVHNYQVGQLETAGPYVGMVSGQVQWGAEGEFAAADSRVHHDMFRPIGSDVPGYQVALFGGLLADLSLGIQQAA